MKKKVCYLIDQVCDDANDQKPLDFTTLGSVFVIMALGLSIAFVILCFEKLLCKFYKH